MNYSNGVEVKNNSSAYLKDRDWEALQALFDRDDSEEIEADIKTNLLLLSPEPFWEDGGFEFLADYI